MSCEVRDLGKFGVALQKIRPSDLRDLLDTKDRSGESPHNAYYKIQQNADHYINAAAVVGMRALLDAVKFGIPLGKIAPHIHSFVNAALVHLAMQKGSWRFSGSAEFVEGYQKFLADGSHREREAKVKDILQIHGKLTVRFVVIDRDGGVSKCGDFMELMINHTERASIILDAFAYADELIKEFKGAHFVLESRDSL